MNLPNITSFRFKDTSFASLMNKRIYNVLLLATRYDAFMLEDDGRIDEQIFNEYTSLNLRYPPRFTQVSSKKEALEELKSIHYDLLILMPNMDDIDIFATANIIKNKYPYIPFAVLTPFSREVSKRLAKEDQSSIDYVFSWLGNSELLVAIIKLMEDAMNAEHDKESVGVQTILVVEDSVRFYSAVLPALYKIVLEESKEFSKEALNDHEQMLRMRGRPKIMLARTYEEAASMYEEYGDSMLGIVTDMSFKHNGEKEKLAGYNLVKWIREKDKFVPIIFTSSELANKKYADEMGCSFIDKNSKSFSKNLKDLVISDFGFGHFKIINPKTEEEIFTIHNLKELQNLIFDIPDEAMLYHISQNHFSRFFYTRALFPIAEWLRGIDIKQFKTVENARKLIYDAIIEYRRIKNSGVVAIFEKDRFDEFSNFARIGDGSLGGKGRSIAFIDTIIKEHTELYSEEEKPLIKIPRTVVISTDVFDEFMESNDLYSHALSDSSDEEILAAFLDARFDDKMAEDLLVFLEVTKAPIAVRSSSLLEDSHHQPFAGVYSTYMVPWKEDREKTLWMLKRAVKAVYASVFFKDSKAYMTATHNLIEQEKMAVVLQEIVGTAYDSHYYPTLSGVARSLNFYPIGNEKADEGIVNIVLGLGKYIVEGGQALRFSPYHPNNIMQLSNIDSALRDTQRYFFALDLNNQTENLSPDDGYNLLKLEVKDAEKDDSLRYITSTYNPADQMIYEGYYEGGRKIVSFSNILQSDKFPLPNLLKTILKMGEQGMGKAVEIEFAADLDKKGNGILSVLQIRPIVQNKELSVKDFSHIEKEESILYSQNVLGHGTSNDICDIVYVKTVDFSAHNNPEIALELESINRKFLVDDKQYVLIGPGRWGSSDPWLGIPVRWTQISNAKVLVEVGLKNYNIEPSQGTHFFQNLTSLGVGYFFIDPNITDGNVYDEDYLNRQKPVYESKYIRHVRFNRSLDVKINGRKKMGLIMKPIREVN